MRINTVLTAGFAAALTANASAALVQIDIYGVVDFNVIGGSHAGIPSGSPVHMGFQVDSDVFVNSGSFPTRGYTVIESSFTMTVGTASVTFDNPQPSPAYFVLRDNDPAVDGFYIAWGGIELPFGLPITEAGLFGDPFEAAFSVGYTGDTLSSLDIAGAAGSYGYGSGGPGTLTSFYFNLVDLGFEVVGIEFTEMTISPVPAPGTLLVASLGLALTRRRR